MRVVLQRVSRAKVTIEGKVHGAIETGLMLLVAISPNDEEETLRKVAMKIVDLRIFDDEQGKMNLSLHEVAGKILSISQFTLYADYRKGRRPGFSNAAKPPFASDMYERFNAILQEEYGAVVETGVFGAEMACELVNDGPITIMIDSEELA